MAPLSEMNLDLIEWERDLLPEHLWIAALADIFPIESVHTQFSDFMDIIDPYIPKGSYAFGLISDFGLVPEEKREEFWNKHQSEIERLFHKPIGRILAFYPDNPASWLVSMKLIKREDSLDPEVELNRLRNLVNKLLPGKDDYAGHLRALPLGRVFKHRIIKISADLPIIELLPKYRVDCTLEEQHHVQSFARITIDMMYREKSQYKSKAWPQQFWRHNFDLAVCQPHNYYIMGSNPVTEESLPLLIEVLSSNVQIARAYITGLWKKVPCDLYDPTRDEILFGLFARLLKFYSLIAENPSIWSRDTGGIFLRCMTECAITFAYLVLRGNQGDFEKFKDYGNGQEKLLMLHLQDNYDGYTTLEGRDFEAISQELGSFNVELIDINLGNWIKKDTRQLAAEAGMERIYKLIFSPASSDVHGTWLSLKQSSLIRCAEPLHRFHRLPSYTEAPAYVNTIQIAQEVCEHCIALAIEKLGYPEFSPSFKAIPLITKRDITNNNH